jgi:hypothetical protein
MLRKTGKSEFELALFDTRSENLQSTLSKDTFSARFDSLCRSDTFRSLGAAL